MKIIFIFIFNSDDELLLNKMIDISSKTFLVVGAVLNENNKYYPQVFLNECL